MEVINVGSSVPKCIARPIRLYHWYFVKLLVSYLLCRVKIKFFVDKYGKIN